MGAIDSSETSALVAPARRDIIEDGILHRRNSLIFISFEMLTSMATVLYPLGSSTVKTDRKQVDISEESVDSIFRI
jgi:hypothetical protein